MTPAWATFMVVSCFLCAVFYGSAGFLLGRKYQLQQNAELLKGLTEKENGKV